MENQEPQTFDPEQYDQKRAAIGVKISAYTGLLNMQRDTLALSFQDKHYYRPIVDTTMLTENIIRNEAEAAKLDEMRPTGSDLVRPHKRQYLLRQSAMLVLHADTILPGYKEIVPHYVDRFNWIEEQLARAEQKPPQLIDEDTIRADLEAFRAQALREARLLKGKGNNVEDKDDENDAKPSKERRKKWGGQVFRLRRHPRK